jgi:hypothetical protein
VLAGAAFSADCDQGGAGEIQKPLPGSPVIVKFGAVPEFIDKGKASELQWRVEGAVRAAIDNQIGDVPVSGSTVVQPPGTTSYILRGFAENGTSIAKKITVTVRDKAFKPQGGVIVWCGSVGPNTRIEIEGNIARTGGKITEGSVPGVPVTLIVDDPDCTIGEEPNAANKYRRVVLTCDKKETAMTMIRLRWEHGQRGTEKQD